MGFQNDNNGQTSTGCSSTAASHQPVLEIPPQTPSVEQTIYKIVEDMMDIVKMVIADHETPPRKVKKLMSAAASVQRVKEMITKELEVMEECIMSAEAKASIDDSLELESYEAVIKMLEDALRL